MSLDQNSSTTFDVILSSLLELLRSKYNQTVFELWFSNLKLRSFDGMNATFSINSDFKCNILSTRYLEDIKKAFEEAVGFAASVEIVSSEKDEGITLPVFSPKPVAPKEEEEEEEEAPPPIETPTIVQKFTFENFIEGESNKFARAACQAVAKNPFKAYNPLFIYGQSGLGKTHLLYAITNEIKKSVPNVKIIYKKGEDFTNELIRAIHDGEVDNFHTKYRNTDILLIDDIQFIAGKESTQEAFFHTFNALYDNEKQIILTSDRPPKEITLLEERLRTRFEWGLLADVQPPSLELRTAIIQKKAESLPLPLDKEIVDYLAASVKENVRQIEGVIKKLAAVSMISSTPITKAMCERIVKEFTTGTIPANMMVENILTCVSDHLGVPLEEIKGKKQKSVIATARHISIYLIHELTDYSLNAIGEVFGRDHSTVMYSIDKIKKEKESDPQLESTIQNLLRKIKT